MNQRLFAFLNRTVNEVIREYNERIGLPSVVSCGYANGYVAIPPCHPLYGVSYHEASKIVVVHYGLTFSALAEELQNEEWYNYTECIGFDSFDEIPKDYWIFGFDTIHNTDGSHQDREWCIAQTKDLMKQLDIITSSDVNEMLLEALKEQLAKSVKYNFNKLWGICNERKKYAFGTEITHCEADLFDTIEELIEYAQFSWDEKNGNPFDEDGDYTGCIYVGTAETYEPADFAPSLDDIAGQMTGTLLHFQNGVPIYDDQDVTYCKKEEAQEEWCEFINKYFDIPCTIIANWNVGIYDLKEHKWVERYEKNKEGEQ